jgi:hypothetical protein
MFNLELVIAQFLRWNLNLVTPSDYLLEFPANKQEAVYDVIIYILLSS